MTISAAISRPRLSVLSTRSKLCGSFGLARCIVRSNCAAAAVKLSGGPSGRSGDTPIRSARRWARHLERGDDTNGKCRLPRQHEARPAADQNRFARAADRLDQLGQMIQIGFLRGVILFPKRQQPVLHHAGRLFVERTDFLDRRCHSMGDRLDQLFVVNLPAQPLADELGELHRHLNPPRG